MSPPGPSLCLMITSSEDFLKLDPIVVLMASLCSMSSFLKSLRSRFRAALVFAVVADSVRILIFPLFAEGAISPLDDILIQNAQCAQASSSTVYMGFYDQSSSRNAKEKQ